MRAHVNVVVVMWVMVWVAVCACTNWRTPTDTEATSFSAVVNSVLTGAAGIGVALSGASKDGKQVREVEAAVPAAVSDAVDAVSA